MKVHKALFRTYWVIDCWIFHFSDRKKSRRERGTCKERMRAQGFFLSWQIRKTKKLSGRHRMQLNRYKCSTVYREISNYTNTEPGNAQKPGGSSVIAWECYTHAKKDISSVWTSILVASHECTPFSQSVLAWSQLAYRIILDTKFQQTGLLGKQRPHTRARKQLQV